jgi:aminoglycoside phosphotransferase (APT) family kinase protein
MALPSHLESLEPLLPVERVGSVLRIEPLTRGPSGASVYAVTTTQGELVLKVQADSPYAARWAQQLRVLRRAAELGIAPPLLHVDDAARTTVSRRIAGVPLPAALGAPEQRTRALASLVEQLRALHALDQEGIDESSPLALARAQFTAQRARPGFPVWVGDLAPLFAELEAQIAGDARRVVGHNDVNPGNVLWDGTRAWLVDFEVAALAHPFYDLAALAMFLMLDDAVALGLLAQQEQRAIAAEQRVAFGALRRLSAIVCGLVMMSLLPDLSLLPATAPTLGEFYAELRAGKLGLHEPRGGAAFGLALLRHGMGV